MTFTDFWANWPDKRNKASAEKAFKKLKPSERAKASTRAADWCRDWRKRNPDASHIHASTYLNQKRFLDQDEIRTEIQERAKGVLELQANWIREGKHFLCQSLPASRVREIVEAGLVTPEECRRAGV